MEPDLTSLLHCLWDIGVSLGTTVCDTLTSLVIIKGDYPIA